jgi:glycosyltransferase involved in cell wall biosynthesis
MKGCHLLLKVFNDLDPGRFELHLCGRVQRDMEREAAASVASRNVFLHGHTNPSRWYAHCDIFVFPSFSDSFAKVVLEAASHAMPIICTEPAQAGVVEHDVSGKLVEPTCRALDIAIRQLVGSPALCTELGANALARAKALSWPRFGEATVDHLLEISAS